MKFHSHDLVSIISQSSHGQIPLLWLLESQHMDLEEKKNIYSLRHSNGPRGSAFCFEMYRSKLLFRDS